MFSLLSIVCSCYQFGVYLRLFGPVQDELPNLGIYKCKTVCVKNICESKEPFKVSMTREETSITCWARTYSEKYISRANILRSIVRLKKWGSASSVINSNLPELITADSVLSVCWKWITTAIGCWLVLDSETTSSFCNSFFILKFSWYTIALSSLKQW